jgi:hypothetical protein
MFETLTAYSAYPPCVQVPFAKLPDAGIGHVIP